MVFSGYNLILDIAIRVVMVLNKILVYGLSLVCFALSLSLSLRVSDLATTTTMFSSLYLKKLCSVLKRA
jgi:hypothetical protein